MPRMSKGDYERACEALKKCATDEVNFNEALLSSENTGTFLIATLKCDSVPRSRLVSTVIFLVALQLEVGGGSLTTTYYDWEGTFGVSLSITRDAAPNEDVGDDWKREEAIS